MNEETRVICLYRVSTLGQVEKKVIFQCNDNAAVNLL